jgi:hypothetical protein
MSSLTVNLVKSSKPRVFSPPVFKLNVEDLKLGLLENTKKLKANPPVLKTLNKKKTEKVKPNEKNERSSLKRRLSKERSSHQKGSHKKEGSKKGSSRRKKSPTQTEEELIDALEDDEGEDVEVDENVEDDSEEEPLSNDESSEEAEEETPVSEPSASDESEVESDSEEDFVKEAKKKKKAKTKEKTKKTKGRFSSTEDSDDSGESDSDVESGSNEDLVVALGGTAASKVVIDETAPEMTREEQIRDLIRKFKIIKRSHPRPDTIPEYTEHDDLDEMKSSFDSIVWELNLDSNVAMYRTMIGGYSMGVEFLASWFDFDMVNFASTHAKLMHKYDSILVEIGAKNETSIVSKFSPEVRLVGLMALHTLMYFAMRYIYNNKGDMAASMFASFTGIPSSTTTETPSEPRKKSTMKGPSVNAEELKRQLEEDDSEEEDEESS